MKLHHILYDLLLPLFGLAMRVAAPFNEKIATGVEGRRGLRERWAKSCAKLNRSGTVLWFHVSSVGEFLQAKPVIDLLHHRMGSALEIALTFFSPSGMDYITRFDRSNRNPAIRLIEYLPLDTRRNQRFCLDTLKPDMIIYVKFDLWPNLITEARRRAIPQILISGTLSPDSKRLSRGVRDYYGALYSKLTAIAAISDEDAQRFRAGSRSGVDIVTAGDTRFDQVCRRIDTSSVQLPRSITQDGRRFLIAGSTWPKDEAVVIPGFKRLLGTISDIGLILVPHEPSHQRLREITRVLENESLPFRLLSTVTDAGQVREPVIIADGVGYLAELYRTGTVAYVGGSFTTGVHNVMEPAVLGLPVLFGPRIQNAYEARCLVELGVGTVVRTPSEFQQATRSLLSDHDRLTALGKKGEQFIRNHCGAAMRCIDLIEKHLQQRKVNRAENV